MRRATWTKEEFYAELSADGEDVIRAKIAAREFGNEKSAQHGLAVEWLRTQEEARSLAASARQASAAERQALSAEVQVKEAKKANAIAKAAIVIAAIAMMVSIGTFAITFLR